MGDKIGQKRTVRSGGVSDIPQILVPPRVAFRALCIGNDLGYRLIRERVIPTIKLPNGPVRVPIDELRKMILSMVTIDKVCRTCSKRDDKGKCVVFSSPPSDLAHCHAWTFDEMWNVKEFAATHAYQMSRK